MRIRNYNRGSMVRVASDEQDRRGSQQHNHKARQTPVPAQQST